MKILNLYPDQQEIMTDLKAAMRRKKSVLLQSATGSGKTAMATKMLSNAVKKGKRAIFTVPRKDLLRQTSETLTSYGINHGFIAAGYDYNPFADVYIGMVDTMARRVDKLPKDIDMTIHDETHFGDVSLSRIINHYKKLEAWTIGLSATPWKMNGQGLGVWYDEMVQGKPIRWLIDNNRLSDYKLFRGRTKLDLSRLKKTAGDYNKKQVGEYMEEKKVIIGDCVKEYRERAMGRLWLVRCASIKNSEIIAEAFRNNGIPAMHVDGNTPDDKKRAIFKAYARREILVLTFADLLTFGFDLAQQTGIDVCVEGISDMKPSMSLANQLQFWGRGLRYKPFPALIHDHVNNSVEHGLPCTDRDWTLDSKTSSARDGDKTSPTKQCTECFFVHPPSPKCPDCGYVYPIQYREVEEVAGDLHEVDINGSSEQISFLPKQINEHTLSHLISYAKKVGKRKPAEWAAKELAKKMCMV